MRLWTKNFQSIDPNRVDVPIRLEVNGVGRGSSDLDVFAAVIEEPVPGSESYPGRSDRHLIGFSNICTHMGCLLVKEDAKLDRDQITGALVCGPCPCHGTLFNLSKGGIVILGPASQHLPQLELSISGDRKSLAGTFPPGGNDPVEELWPSRTQS